MSVEQSAAWPARWSDGLSYRIYLNLEETIAAGYGPEDIVAESGFLDGGVIGDLQVADAAQSLYFVEVSYAGVEFGPGQGNDYRRESQVKIGLRTGIPAIVRILERSVAGRAAVRAVPR